MPHTWVCAKTVCWLKLHDVVEHMSSAHTHLRRVNAFHPVNFHSTRHGSGNRFALTVTHCERSEARGGRMSRPASSAGDLKIDVNVQSVCLNFVSYCVFVTLVMYIHNELDVYGIAFV